MIKFWCRPKSGCRQLTSPSFFMWMNGTLWSLFYKYTHPKLWELPSWTNHLPPYRPLCHVEARISVYEYQGNRFQYMKPGGQISVYEYQGDGFQYMNTRGMDFNMWIQGGWISIYEYQGDTNNQTQQWNNDFTYLCRILVILYVFIITEQEHVLNKCVCVCMYAYIPHLYKYTYIYYQSGTKVVVVWDWEF